MFLPSTPEHGPGILRFGPLLGQRCYRHIPVVSDLGSCGDCIRYRTFPSPGTTCACCGLFCKAAVGSAAESLVNLPRRQRRKVQSCCVMAESTSRQLYPNLFYLFGAFFTPFHPISFPKPFSKLIRYVRITTIYIPENADPCHLTT